MDKALFEAHPEYGRLYTWAAANPGTAYNDTDDNPTNRQGICPEGWHLPSKNEWDKLIQVIGDDENEIYSSYAGKGYAAIKMRSKTKVDNAETKGESHASYNNGIDILLLGGMWKDDPYYWGTCILWSSSSTGPTGAFKLSFSAGSMGGVGLSENDKRAQYSVRCKAN
jgi:uncharacterized protein (TIGR02145 family)